MHLILVSIILREATAYGDSRQSREPEVSTTALLFAIGWLSVGLHIHKAGVLAATSFLLAPEQAVTDFCNTAMHSRYAGLWDNSNIAHSCHSGEWWHQDVAMSHEISVAQHASMISRIADGNWDAVTVPQEYLLNAACIIRKHGIKHHNLKARSSIKAFWSHPHGNCGLARGGSSYRWHHNNTRLVLVAVYTCLLCFCWRDASRMILPACSAPCAE